MAILDHPLPVHNKCFRRPIDTKINGQGPLVIHDTEEKLVLVSFQPPDHLA